MFFFLIISSLFFSFCLDENKKTPSNEQGGVSFERTLPLFPPLPLSLSLASLACGKQDGIPHHVHAYRAEESRRCAREPGEVLDVELFVVTAVATLDESLWDGEIKYGRVSLNAFRELKKCHVQRASCRGWVMAGERKTREKLRATQGCSKCFMVSRAS